MAKKKERLAGSWHYVLEGDRTLPIDEQTRFTLRPMTGPEREQFVDSMSVGEVDPATGTMLIRPRTRAAAREACLTFIDRVENFPAGAPIEWPKTRDERKAYLETLSDDDVYEVGNEIYKRSRMGKEEEAKQLGESSTPALTSN